MLTALTRAFAGVGLYVVRPVAQVDLDAAGAGVALTDLLPGARAGLVVGDGGGDFFARFRAAGGSGPDPLDRHTERAVAEALSEVEELGDHTLCFPFDARPLPMQRLGRAAGLPAPGPLGIQIHGDFGPWWAYRAFVVLTQALPALPPLPAPCTGCPAPCASACPGHAVAPGPAFDIAACATHRLAHLPCEEDCAARRACVIAPARAYPPEQLAFHMRAALVMIRAYRPA